MPGSSRRTIAVRLVGGVLWTFLGFWGLLASPGNALAEPVSANSEVPGSPHGDLDRPCAQCHTAEAWVPARIASDFDHGSFGFPLQGAHAAADCSFCHRTLEFTALDPNCASCHQDIHSGAFGVDCALCHGTRSFIDRSDQLSMHQLSQFPLTGHHATLDCDQCHSIGNAGAQFSNTPAECYGCHRQEFQSTSLPDHVQAGFGTDCSECHGTVAWAGGSAGNHDFFPLKGGHGALDCQACHTSGQFSRLDPDCVSCHRQEYDATTQPSHQAAGFSTDCEGCHTIQTWNSGAFDHATTSFALTGGHIGVDCSQCHTQATYSAAPIECNGCHNVDYVSVVDPNHVTAQFPLECEVCHTTSTWTGATFDHSLSAFPLTGAHRTVDCAQCHVNGTYSGVRTDCYACHRQEFETTSNPAHLPAGFGTDCEACHTTIAWEGATFDHDSSWFPIYTGRHREEWNDCSECHTNAATYSVYDCLGCHPHSDKNKTDEQHRGEAADYRYDSIACYDCHPRGRGD